MRTGKTPRPGTPTPIPGAAGKSVEVRPATPPPRTKQSRSGSISTTLPAGARIEDVLADDADSAADDPGRSARPSKDPMSSTLESAELGRYLNMIREEHATSILLIEHDMSVVMGVSDHVIVLDHGLKIADGPPREVSNDPRVIAAYLGVEQDEVTEDVEVRR